MRVITPEPLTSFKPTKGRTLFYVALAIVFASSTAPAYQIGGYPGAFLQMGVGAKAISMGGAFVGMADDVSAVYWNPAGLAQLSGTHFTAMHTFMTLDRGHNFFSRVTRYGERHALGLSWLSYRVGNIQGRDEFGNPTDDFSDSENGFILSYATSSKRIAGPKISVGVNFKYLYQNLASKVAHGIGFDAGIRIQLSDYVALGLIVQDIGSALKWQESQHKNTVPLTLRSGASIKLFNLPAAVTVDLEKNAEQALRMHFGTEFRLPFFLSLRAGYENGFKLGVGFRLSDFSLDYAVCTGSELGIVHFVSLNIGS